MSLDPNPFVVAKLHDGRRLTVNTYEIVYVEDNVSDHTCAIKLKTGEMFKLDMQMDEFMYSMYSGRQRHSS
jgi:hypothetical protein